MNKKHTKKIALSLAIAVGSTNCLASVSAADTPIQGNELIDLGAGENANISTNSAIDLPSDILVTTEAALSIEPKATIGVNTSNVTITEGMERPLVTVTITSPSQDIENLLNEAQISKDIEIDLMVKTENSTVFKSTDFQNLIQYSIVNLDLRQCYQIETVSLINTPFKRCIKNIDLGITPTTIGNSFSFVFEKGAHIESIIIPDNTSLTIGDTNSDRAEDLTIDKISYVTMGPVSPTKPNNKITLYNLTLGELDLKRSEDTQLFFKNVTYLKDFIIDVVKSYYNGQLVTWDHSEYNNCTFKGNLEIKEEGNIRTFTNNIVEGDCTLRTNSTATTIQSLTVLGTLKIVDSNMVRPSMFGGCKFNKVELCDTITTIGSYAFICSNFKELTLPVNVDMIGELAFSETTIENIYNLEYVSKIGPKAFFKANHLKSVTLGAKDGTIIATSAFANCSELTDVNFLDGTIKLLEGAFNSISAEQIIIPAKITEIPPYCFANGKLKKVIFEHIAESPLTIYENAFAYNKELGELVCPIKTENKLIKQNAFLKCALDLSIGETYDILITYANSLTSFANLQVPYVTYQLAHNKITSGMVIKDMIDVTTVNDMPLQNLLRTTWYDSSCYGKQIQYNVYELIEGQRIKKSLSDTLTQGKHILIVEPIEGVNGYGKTMEIEVGDTGLLARPITTIYDKAQPIELKKMVKVFANGADITSLELVKVNTSIDLETLALGSYEIPITITYRNQNILVLAKVTVIDSSLEEIDNEKQVKPLPDIYEILPQTPIVTNTDNSSNITTILQVKKNDNLMSDWDLSTMIVKVEDTIIEPSKQIIKTSKLSDLTVGNHNIRFTLRDGDCESIVNVPVIIKFSTNTLQANLRNDQNPWILKKGVDKVGDILDFDIKYKLNSNYDFENYIGDDLKITLNTDISNLEIPKAGYYIIPRARVEIPSLECDETVYFSAKVVENVEDYFSVNSMPLIAQTVDTINLGNLIINYNGNNVRDLCDVTLLTDVNALIPNTVNTVQYHVICEKYGVDKVLEGKILLGNIISTDAVIFEYQIGSSLQQQLETVYPNGIPTDLTIEGSGIITSADMNYLGKQQIKRLDLSNANTNLNELSDVSFQNNILIEEFVNFKTKDVDIYDFQFKGCINLRKIDLGITSTIGYNAFENCKSLKSLTVDNLTQGICIYDSAFAGSGLESVELKGEGDCTLEGAFKNARNLTTFKADNTLIFSLFDGPFKNTKLTGDLTMTIDFWNNNSNFEGLTLNNVILSTSSSQRGMSIYSGFKNCTINSFSFEGNDIAIAGSTGSLFEDCTIGTLAIIGKDILQNSTYGFFLLGSKQPQILNCEIDNLICRDIPLTTNGVAFYNCSINNMIMDNISIFANGSVFFEKCTGLEEIYMNLAAKTRGIELSNSLFLNCRDLKSIVLDLNNFNTTQSYCILDIRSPIAVDCPNLSVFDIRNKPADVKYNLNNLFMKNCGYIPNFDFLKENFVVWPQRVIDDYFADMVPYVEVVGGNIIEIYENDIIPFNLLASLKTKTGEDYNNLLDYQWYNAATHKERTILDFEIVNKKTRQKADYTKSLPEGEYLVYTKLLNDTDLNRVPAVSTLIVKSASDLHSEGKDLVIVEGESVNPKLLYSATFGDDNQDVTDQCTFEILNDTDLTNLSKGTHEINLVVNYNGYSDLATSTVTVLEKQGEASIVGNVIAPSSDLVIKINGTLSNKQNINTVVSKPQDVAINIVDKNNIYKPTEIIVPVTLDQIKANEQIQLEDIALESYPLELTTKQVTVSNKAQVITASDFFESLKSNGMTLIPKDLIYKIMDNGTEVSLKEALQSNKTYEVILTATSDVRSVSATTQLIVNLQAEKPDDPKPPVTEPNEPEIPITKPSTSTTVQKVIDNFPYTLPKGYDLKPLLNGIKVLKGDVDTFGIKNFKVEKNGAVGTFDVLSDNLGEDIPKLPFTDTLKHWAGEDIEKARVLGIVKGSETDLFKPNRAVTISESLAILDRVFLSNGMVDMTSTRSTVEYALPSKEMWYYFNAGSILSKMDRQEVTKANNLIKGNYSRAITRGELALILSQICDTLPTVNTQKYVFTDTYNSPYNVALQDCWAKGLLVGKSSTKMAPKDTLTRAELTVIALRLHNLYK